MHLKNPELLEQLRYNKKLSRTALAALAVKADGKPPSRQYVSRYLDGHRTKASPALAKSLAAALGVDTDTLWSDT